MIYYLITNDDNEVKCIVNSDNWFIPIDANNTDYIAYLAWVAEGNTAEEWTGN